MSALVTIEHHDKFTPEFLGQAREEAFILRDYPPHQTGMALTHDISYTVTDLETHDGYLCVSPIRYQEADAALREEAPTLYELVATLETMPYKLGNTIPARNPSIIINFSEPGGEVSRHVDVGTTVRNWLGRCVSLSSTGLMRYYESDVSDKIIGEVSVQAGDITNHFNPADRTKRLSHDVQNTGDETRISVGLLIALKRGVLGRQRTAQQAAHATIEG